MKNIRLIVLFVVVLLFGYVAPTNAQPTWYTRNLSWSPDESKVVFIGYQDQAYYTIIVADSSGSNAKKLVRLKSANDKDKTNIPRWSPDGRIVFRQDERNKPGMLSIMETTGKNIQPLVKGKDVADFAWSPDGKSLAYTELRNLYVMKVDDQNSSQLLAKDVSDPKWSPDSKSILYHRYDDCWVLRLEDLNVYKVDIEGNPRKCNPIGTIWFPDSKRILTNFKGRDNNILTINIETNERSTSHGPVIDSYPNAATESFYPKSWDPRGKWLAFEGKVFSRGYKREAEVDDYFGDNILLWNLKGEEEVHRPQIRWHTRGSNLVWAPNGFEISYTVDLVWWDSDKGQQVYISYPDGKFPHQFYFTFE